MTRRKKIIIGVITVVIIGVIAAFLWWWFTRANLNNPVNQNVNQNPSEIQVPATLPTASAGLPDTTGVPEEQKDSQAELKAIAFTFAERFGSYSNEVYFSNLDDSADLMTAKMKAWVENFKLSQRQADNSEYYGVTTKAIAAEISEFDQDFNRAEVIVSTQRSESIVSTDNPRAFYQKLKLSMTQVDGAWKVDAAEWQ
ncbi:MAG: hypothetical protein HUU49_02885 [Candidatus Buchananbacteria bacterium]|nr:hypothetical protein [Candidatus Buchananbacteria bacterium]